MASNLGFLEEVVPNANHWGCSSPAELASILAILVMAGRSPAFDLLQERLLDVGRVWDELMIIGL
jgi:hypothetical protein